MIYRLNFNACRLDFCRLFPPPRPCCTSLRQIIVAWQHQRWVWHTTFYKEASHVMFYEDIKVQFCLVFAFWGRNGRVFRPNHMRAILNFDDHLYLFLTSFRLNLQVLPRTRTYTLCLQEAVGESIFCCRVPRLNHLGYFPPALPHPQYRQTTCT